RRLSYSSYPRSSPRPPTAAPKGRRRRLGAAGQPRPLYPGAPRRAFRSGTKPSASHSHREKRRTQRKRFALAGWRCEYLRGLVVGDFAGEAEFLDHQVPVGASDDPLVVGVDVAVGDEEPPRMRPYRRVLVQPRSHLPGASQAGTLADKADQLGASEALLQLADPVVHLPEDALVLCCADGLRQGAQKLSPDPRLNQAQQGICRSWTRADARSGSRSTKSPSGKRTRSSARSSQAPTIAASTHTRSCASAATAT